MIPQRDAQAGGDEHSDKHTAMEPPANLSTVVVHKKRQSNDRGNKGADQKCAVHPSNVAQRLGEIHNVANVAVSGSSRKGEELRPRSRDGNLFFTLFPAMPSGPFLGLSRALEFAHDFALADLSDRVDFGAVIIGFAWPSGGDQAAQRLVHRRG